MNSGIQRLITLALTFVTTAMVFAQDAKEAEQYPEVEKFVGVWNGVITVQSEYSSRSSWVILEISHWRDREVNVTIDWPRHRIRRTSGTGMITPNSLKWVTLEIDNVGNQALLGTFLASVSHDNNLVGEYFRDGDSKKGGSFTFNRVDLQELKEFNKEKLRTLNRLKLAANDSTFLNPGWRKLLPSALAWLESQLGMDSKVITKKAVANLEYAKKLATSLEGKENFYAKNEGTPIPLMLPLSISQSINIKNYTVTLPKDFKGENDKIYPMRIKLHGSGGARSRLHYDPDKTTNDDSFLVVRPISESFWVPYSLNSLLAEIKTLLPIDEDRIYLSGESMGGTGTFDWAMANPEHFAAIAIIAGSGDVFRAPRLKNTPVWIFHGMQDRNVYFYKAETMLTALEECGADVKHTFYHRGGITFLTVWIVHRSIVGF